MIGVFAAQTQIDPYRADFTLTQISHAPLLRVVIECDGWEYHSTQEDQSHDRKRENYMKSRGWSVVRFAGKDIVRDAAGRVDVLEDIIKCRLRGYRGVVA